VFSHPSQTFFSSVYKCYFGKVGRLASEEVTLQLAKSKCIPVLIYGLECFSLRKADVKSLDFAAVVRFLMKLFNSANIDIINTCRWYFDFQLPSEVLVKRVPNSRGNLRTVKIYTVILVYRRKLVTLKVYFVHTVIN